MYQCMFITAMYIFGIIEGAFTATWWLFILTFLADAAIAGAIGR